MAVYALLERLPPHIDRELDLLINSNQEAPSLSTKLNKIQEGFHEAEREGVTNKNIKRWLKEVEDATYEMDDVLDEWVAANHRVEVQDTSLNWDKVRTLLLSLCLCFKELVSRREILKKIKALSMRIDTILTLKLYTFVPSENYRAQVFRKEESISLFSEGFKSYGLEKAKKSLVQKLVLEGESSDKDTQLISIVGVGGIGKSTLAREAYNDPEVDNIFALKGWVSVSQNFDPLAISKAILESFGVKSDGDNYLEMLVQRIKKVVNNKRFLLVLDDVWADDRYMWERLRSCLDGGKGSRIVVTTRLEFVARMMGTTQWQFLGLLSDEDCGNILNGVALEGRSMEESETLRRIGMDIAKKCNGLPLAARFVGSMLALRSSVREWKAVLQSPLWNVEDEVSDLFRLLNLSYTDLSPLLKRCFLSCAIFPKGTSISIYEITRIWMAYGYLNSSYSADEVQSKAFRYLNNLAMASFFQRAAIDDTYDDYRKSYKMEDIMHDFATYLSGSDEYSFIMNGGLENERSSFSHINLPWDSLGRLRTFSVCREELRPDIVSHLTSVRVLSMIACGLQGLPKDIGKLIHLRYLNVSENPIKELPGTITDLWNLQTLDIGSCEKLSSLPEGIKKLINLRHLLNAGTVQLVEYPQGLEKLSGLWTLSEFRGCKLGLLRNMNQLRGSLTLILGDIDEGELGDPKLWEKQHIEELKMCFGKEEEMNEVVEMLKPPPNLRTLQVSSESGKWLSRWITYFDNLKVLEFNGHHMSTDVPPFCKLPALEELAMNAIGFKRLSMEFLGVGNASSSSSSRQGAGGFPRLKKLRFEGCRSWREWEDIEEESVPVLTSLEELEFKECDNLLALPLTLLGNATSLRLVTASNSEYLSQRYNKISGDDRDKIPLLPNQIWNV